MATTTTNFGWTVPTSTDLVKNGATAISTLGSGVDTSFVGLKGGTTGQVLSKTSGTDLAFTWINNDTGDITGITTGVSSGLTGGVTSGTADLSLLLNFNAQTGTTYTLVAADANKLVTSSNASAVTITVPPSVFSAGQMINVQSIGVGLTSFAQGSGVTITSTGATASAPTLRARYSACTIICTASNTFTIVGDLS
jgi:hypothetical protein